MFLIIFKNNLFNNLNYFPYYEMKIKEYITEMKPITIKIQEIIYPIMTLTFVFFIYCRVINNR